MYLNFLDYRILSIFNDQNIASSRGRYASVHGRMTYTIYAYTKKFLKQPIPRARIRVDLIDATRGY